MGFFSAIAAAAACRRLLYALLLALLPWQTWDTLQSCSRLGRVPRAEFHETCSNQPETKLQVCSTILSQGAVVTFQWKAGYETQFLNFLIVWVVNSGWQHRYKSLTERRNHNADGQQVLPGWLACRHCKQEFTVPKCCHIGNFGRIDGSKLTVHKKSSMFSLELLDSLSLWFS
jgi:hypothetical protein